MSSIVHDCEERLAEDEFSDYEEELEQHDSTTPHRKSFLEVKFSTINITNDQITLLKQLERAHHQDGEAIFQKVYDQVLADPRFYSEGPNITHFFNCHTKKIIKNYSKCFGFFYEVLVNYEKFPFLVNCCDSKTHDGINVLNSDATSTTKYEAMLELFNYFMMSKNKMMNMLLLPYLMNLDNCNLYASHLMIKKLKALESFSRRVVFLKNNSTTVREFVKRPNSFIGWSELMHVYQRLVSEIVNRYEVVKHNNQKLYVNGIHVGPSYLKDLYNKALADFKDKFTTIGYLLGGGYDIEEVYERFIESEDPWSERLISVFESQVFFSVDDKVDKKLVIDIIDAMTIDLLILCYISGGDLFRFPELRTIQFNADCQNINTIFFNCQIFIRMFTNKPEFEKPLALLPHQLGKLMIAYISAIRPLYIKLHDGKLPKVAESFMHNARSPQENTSDIFYKCYIFVNSKGTFISSYEFKRQISILLGRNVTKIINPWIVRKAISYYFEKDIIPKAEANDDVIRQQARNYPRSDTPIPKLDEVRCRCICMEWFRFIDIENFGTYSPITSDDKEPQESDILLWINGDDVREAVGKINLTAQQMGLLCDVTLSTTEVDMVIAAGHGSVNVMFCELVMKTHKIASRRQGNKKILNLMLVPYDTLKYDVIARFEKAGLNVCSPDAFTVRRAEGHHDALVGCYDDLESHRFIEFLFNFRQSFGNKYRLGTIFIYQCHALVHPKWRKFNELVKHVALIFYQTIMISATIPKGFISHPRITIECDRYINLINSDPFATVFQTSTCLEGDDKLKEYVRLVLTNFLARSSNDIIMLYFDFKLLQNQYHQWICMEFGDEMTVMLNTDTPNKSELIDKLGSSARILLGTKVVSCGIDVPQVNYLIYIDSEVSVLDYIQIQGLTRGSAVTNMLYQCPKKEKDNIDVTRCLTQQVAEFYDLKVDSCNCCEVDESSFDDTVKELLANVHHATEIQFEKVKFGNERQTKRRRVEFSEEQKLEKFASEFVIEDWMEEVMERGAKYLRYPIVDMEAIPEDACRKCFGSHSGTQCNRKELETLMVLFWVFNKVDFEKIRKIKIAGEANCMYSWAMENNLKQCYDSYMEKVEKYSVKCKVDIEDVIPDYLKSLDILNRYGVIPFYLREFARNAPKPYYPPTLDIKVSRYGEQHMYIQTDNLIGLARFDKKFCQKCGAMIHSGNCRYNQTMEIFYIIFCDSKYPFYKSCAEQDLTFRLFTDWISSISRSGVHMEVLVNVMKQEKLLNKKVYWE
ncbi:hypothetical protein JA1_005357 [Spathaspora sp. JA1]|nr:hypothetical protein JA1_005357 [Spathaspora sp. JA1]